MKRKNNLFLALITMLTLLPFVSVKAEEDGTADFTVNVTDSTPPTVISYVTTINQDISIDMAKNYNGYAWIKVENQGNVALDVEYYGVEAIGDTNVPIWTLEDYNNGTLEEKNVQILVQNSEFTLKPAGYVMSKTLTSETDGEEYSFTSEYDNVGLMELHVKLSDNYFISEDDVLKYAVTIVVEPNTDDYEYETGLYSSYDEETGKLYYLTAFIEDTSLSEDYTVSSYLRSSYLYHGQPYKEGVEDRLTEIATSSLQISNTQTIHYTLYEDGNEYNAIDYGVVRLLWHANHYNSSTNDVIDCANLYKHSWYRYLSDDIPLFSNYYKS